MVIDKKLSSDDVVEALLGLSKTLVAVATRTIPDAGVTLPQLRALVVLAELPRLRPGVLADALGVAPSSATRICDRLVARGLIARSEAEPDRREVELALTKEGLKLVRTAMGLRRAALRELAARVLPEDRAVFVRCCDEVAGPADDEERVGAAR